MAAFIDAKGSTQQIEANLDMVRAAKENGMSFRDYVNSTYDTNAEKYGDAFSQLCASEGIVLQPNKQYGMKASSLDAVLNGRTVLEAGTIVRNPSNQGRVLLMPAIGALVEDKLVADLNMNADEFDRIIAQDDTIADEWLLWPEINFVGPEAARSQVTSQLAKPTTMMSVTTSEKSVRIPTYSLGIEWSEQATKYVNLDLLALAIARQVAVERNDRANTNLLNLLNGDADMGQASLSSLGKVTTALSLDSAATSGITQKAWMLWCYQNSKKRKLNYLVTDIAGAMAIENRTGKPVITGDNPNSPRIDANVRVSNPTWMAELPVFIVDPSVGWPAKTILGLDTRYAIQRVNSTNASYQAQEDFVLRRGSAMRFDFGTICRRLFNDAFEVLTYA
jgi:hypothetical protein